MVTKCVSTGCLTRYLAVRESPTTLITLLYIDLEG